MPEPTKEDNKEKPATDSESNIDDCLSGCLGGEVFWGGLIVNSFVASVWLLQTWFPHNNFLVIVLCLPLTILIIIVTWALLTLIGLSIGLAVTKIVKIIRPNK